jgi:hypothetical protein
LTNEILLIGKKKYGKPIHIACKVRGKPFAAFISGNNFVYLRNWDEQSILELQREGL